MTPIRKGSRWRERGNPQRVVEVIEVRGKSVVYFVPLTRGRGVGDLDFWERFYEPVAEERKDGAS